MQVGQEMVTDGGGQKAREKAVGVEDKPIGSRRPRKPLV